MNIKRVLAYLLFIMIVSSCSKGVLQEIDPESIHQVSVEKIKEIENNRIKSISGNVLIINDSLWIHNLFYKYLKSAKKEPCKFVSLYKVSFLFDNHLYDLYINSNKLIYQNETYVLEYNLEEYISSGR